MDFDHIVAKYPGERYQPHFSLLFGNALKHLYHSAAHALVSQIGKKQISASFSYSNIVAVILLEYPYCFIDYFACK